MNLTQNDLGHGFLFRRKGNQNAIGRLDLSRGLRIATIGLHSDCNFYFDDWEGIPITDKILTDWFGFVEKPGRTFDNINNPYFAKDGVLLFFSESDRAFARYPVLPGTGFHHGDVSLAGTTKWIDYVHEVQRYYLSATHKPLEGGPK